MSRVGTSYTHNKDSLFFNLYENIRTQLPNSIHDPHTVAPILSVEDLALKWKAEQPLVSHCNFTVDSREVVSIYGETGIGKTSLAKVLSGYIRPSKGIVKICGCAYSYTHKVRFAYQRSMIQLIPQIVSSSFHPLLTIRRSMDDSYTMFEKKVKSFVVRDIKKLMKLKDSELWDRKKSEKENLRTLFELCIIELCEFMKMSPDLLTRGVYELSGGQLQRCSLIRALLVFPSILILDEPVNQLDVDLRKVMLELIYSIIINTNVGVLLISHLMEVHRYFSTQSQYRGYEISNSNFNTLSPAGV